LAEKLCFVIGPIGKDGSQERKHADLLLYLVIKHVLEVDEFGYKVRRSDEDANPGMIGDRVISDIISAELVITDLTDLNPNVFYELGIRHSTEKPVIHIVKAGTLLPFDNAGYRTNFVDLTDIHSIERCRNQVAASIREIGQPGYQVSNPITQANATFRMRGSADPHDRVISGLAEKIEILSNRISRRVPPSPQTNLTGVIPPREDVHPRILDGKPAKATGYGIGPNGEVVVMVDVDGTQSTLGQEAWRKLPVWIGRLETSFGPVSGQTTRDKLDK
jgi:hypothetical protein